jgi:hypothetical protein
MDLPAIVRRANIEAVIQALKNEGAITAVFINAVLFDFRDENAQDRLWDYPGDKPLLDDDTVGMELSKDIINSFSLEDNVLSFDAEIDGELLSFNIPTNLILSINGINASHKICVIEQFAPFLLRPDESTDEASYEGNVVPLFN